MKINKWIFLLMAFAIGLMSLNILAAPPCQTATVDGTLGSFRTGTNGETNGFFLGTNPGSTEVGFPASVSSQVTAIVSVGSTVRVSGCLHTSPSGSTRLEAQTITNTQNGQTVTVGSSPPEPPTCTSTTVQGTLVEFVTSPSGSVRGFDLNTNPGTLEIRFPPHVSSQVTAIVAVGNSVSVTGCTHTGPMGDTHFNAQTITNTQTGQTVTVTSPPSPPTPPTQPTCTTVTRTGSVSSFRAGRGGNGFFIGTGSGAVSVEYPPIYSNQIRSIVSVNSSVSVTGCERTGPRGEVKLEAQTVTNTQTGQSVTITRP